VRWLALFVVFVVALALSMVWVSVSAQAPASKDSLVYTSTPKYDAEAWLSGGERFPAGAQLILTEKATSRPLVARFAATADANVSFDGTRILFAGKHEATDHWDIWEVALTGGDPKRITWCDSDCVRPFYLPGGRLVCARKVNGRFVLQAAAFAEAAPLELTYSPASALPTDVLGDGRILFESSYPMGSGTSPEIYTVYSDGSGVEAYRCDHGAKRQAGKQAPSGDIVFASAYGIGRFTSALAHEVAVKVPAGEFAGDAVTTSTGSMVVAWRTDAKSHYALGFWNSQTGSLETLVQASTADLVQPSIVEARHVPNQHPSGLHDWGYATLLCLNAYTSQYNFAPGTIAMMRLYTTNEKGKPVLLGSSTVEPDGSFYVQVPADKPLAMELLDRQGKTLKREQGWWWMRKGEQRICVGCHAGPERSPENAVPAVLVKSTIPVNLTGGAAASAKGGR
jgi:hypothetical protein